MSVCATLRCYNCVALGEAEFTEEEIDNVLREFERTGIRMPAFTKIDGLLREQLTLDQAAVHAAEVAVYEALEQMSAERVQLCLGNPALDLEPHMAEPHARLYYEALQMWRAGKLNQLGASCDGVSERSRSEIDAYDYILSRAELFQAIAEVNEEKEVERMAAARVEVVAQLNQILTLDTSASHQHLTQLLANQESGFTGVTAVHSVWYYDVMSRARTEKNADLFWEEIRDLIRLANSVALNSKNIETVLLKIDHALDNGSHSNLLIGLRSEELELQEVVADNVEGYFENFLSQRGVKRESSGAQEILNEVEVQQGVQLTNQNAGLEALHSLAIQSINSSLPRNEPETTLSHLTAPHARIQAVVPAYRDRYHDALVELSRHASGSFLSHEEIQESVEKVNTEMSLVERIRELILEGDDDSAILSLLSQLFGACGQLLVPQNAPHYCDLIRREFTQSSGRTLTSVELLEIVSDGNESAELSVELSREVFEFNTYLESAVDPAETLQRLLAPSLSLQGLSEACATQFHKELTRLRIRNLNAKLLSPVSSPGLWLGGESIDGFPFFFQTESGEYSWRRSGSCHLDTSLLSNTSIQSVVSSISAMNDRELHFARQVGAIIRIQSYLKMVLARRKFRGKVAHYNAHIPEIVRAQSAVRCHLAMKSYQLIVSASDPPVSSLRKYLPLLEQSERDVQEELELTELKSELVTKIRRNKQLEEDLDGLDTKIGLLVRNRLSVMDVVHTTSKLERRRLAARSQSKGIQHFTKENKQLLGGYAHLFYLLQTDPRYFANLIFDMPGGRTTAFVQEVVLTVFNYASTNREHFLLLKLFETALRREIFSKVEKIDDVIIGNPTVVKLIISFTRRMDFQQHHLKSVLGPLVEKVLHSEDRISLNPVDIYKGWLSQTEIETGEPSRYPYEVSNLQALDHPEVRERLSEAMKTVSAAADEFMEAIFSNARTLPYGLRYMASKLGHFLRERFPRAGDEEIGKVTGNLIYYRFLNPVIAAPDAFEVVELEAGASLENEQRKRLGSIARILQHAAACKLFEGEYACLSALNPYIRASHARFSQYFAAAADVPSAEEKFDIGEYSDLVMISRPVINISAKEIISTHKLLLAHLDAVAPLPSGDDPLREVLVALGDTPDIRNLLGELEDRNLPAEELQERWVELGRQEIMLTLVNKYEGIQQDKQALDTNAKFLEAKGMAVDLIKVHPGDNLPDIISAVHSAATEQAFDRLVQKSADHDLITSSIAPSQTRNYTLSELKYFLRENLELLEERGVVSAADGYQHILNAIARDIRNQHRYRRERRSEKERLSTAIEQLDRKLAFLDEQYADYRKYVETATANMSKGAKKLPPTPDQQTSPVLAAANFRSKTIRYSAQKLFDKGILIEIDGVSKSQFKALFFEIVSVSHGSFDINAKMLGLPAESVHVVFEDLLQHRFENVQIMKLLGRVKVNVNLLIYLINKKFYGK